MILEDDVVFHAEIRERLAEITLPDDWGIFYFGCAHRKRPRSAGAGIVRVAYALDTHAFAVRAPYFRRVIAGLDARHPVNRGCGHALASDWFLADLHATIPTYACYPNLAWQAVSPSDLAGGTYSNYTASGEQVSGKGELVGLQAEMWGGTRWRPAGPVVVQEPKEADQGNNASPRLGLLFLTRGDVNQPDVWREFVNESAGGVKVFSHPKDAGAADAGFLAGSLIKQRIETKWGDVSLVRAMMALLREGLKDDSLTHFAFLSESCVPVRPWGEIKRRLRTDPRSMLDETDANEMKPEHFRRIAKAWGVPARCWRMHSQWCLLARDAAECVTEFDFTEHFKSVFAADEHYIGTVLALRGFDEERRISRCATTWVRWGDESGTSRPQTIGAVDVLLAGELAGFPGFFARKIANDSEIGRWRLHLAGCGHQ